LRNGPETVEGPTGGDDLLALDVVTDGHLEKPLAMKAFG
jgi:hypothetical protein